MANEEHLKILKQKVGVWIQWRKDNPDVQPDFYKANLPGMDLRQYDLSGANLNRANLSEVNLRSTSISGADLNGANLFQAILCGADLSKADLSGASLFGADCSLADLGGTNLSKADLRDVNFSGAILGGADLSEAFMMRAIFGGVDLREVRGLARVKQAGPSTIGIDTIYLSQGKIPEEFLRGAGTPEKFITYATSLAGGAIHYYSCFISYSSQDDDFAQRLHLDLQQRGVRCWFAPEDLKIGDKLRQTIHRSIQSQEKLLLILSENSIDSDWVETEVETAFEKEHKQGQPVLFPIRLDQAVLETDQAWAADIRRMRHIGDFSRWKDSDAYQQAFERLLRDLKVA
jgi:hypothetical protein